MQDASQPGQDSHLEQPEAAPGGSSPASRTAKLRDWLTVNEIFFKASAPLVSLVALLISIAALTAAIRTANIASEKFRLAVTERSLTLRVVQEITGDTTRDMKEVITISYTGHVPRDMLYRASFTVMIDIDAPGKVQTYIPFEYYYAEERMELSDNDRTLVLKNENIGAVYLAFEKHHSNNGLSQREHGCIIMFFRDITI